MAAVAVVAVVAGCTPEAAAPDVSAAVVVPALSAAAEVSGLSAVAVVVAFAPSAVAVVFVAAAPSRATGLHEDMRARSAVFIHRHDILHRAG